MMELSSAYPFDIFGCDVYTPTSGGRSSSLSQLTCGVETTIHVLIMQVCKPVFALYTSSKNMYMSWIDCRMFSLLVAKLRCFLFEAEKAHSDHKTNDTIS